MYIRLRDFSHMTMMGISQNFVSVAQIGTAPIHFSDDIKSPCCCHIVGREIPFSYCQVRTVPKRYTMTLNFGQFVWESYKIVETKAALDQPVLMQYTSSLDMRTTVWKGTNLYISLHACCEFFTF